MKIHLCSVLGCVNSIICCAAYLVHLHCETQIFWLYFIELWFWLTWLLFFMHWRLFRANCFVYKTTTKYQVSPSLNSVIRFTNLSLIITIPWEERKTANNKNTSKSKHHYKPNTNHMNNEWDTTSSFYLYKQYKATTSIAYQNVLIDCRHLFTQTIVIKTH